MARLFQTEKSRMGRSSFKKDKAEFLQESLRKRSLLPIEFDEDDDDDDDEEADDEEDEDYEEK